MLYSTLVFLLLLFKVAQTLDPISDNSSGPNDMNVNQLSSLASTAVYSIKLFGLEAGQSYYTQMAVGNPSDATAPDFTDPTLQNRNTYNLIVDTGSSNVAIAGDCCRNAYSCAESSSCQDQSRGTSIYYGQGSISGNLVKDSFYLDSNNIVLSSIPFVQINAHQTFFQAGYDGIVGTAFKALAQPTDVLPPTIHDQMINQLSSSGLNSFGIQLCGIRQTVLQTGVPTNPSSPAGTWLVGGRDLENGEKMFSGDMILTPILQEKWYVVGVTAIGIADEVLDINCAEYNEPHAIIDSGTTNMIFPSAVYESITQELIAAVRQLDEDFPIRFFSSDSPCCDVRRCGGTNPDATVLSLPPIKISLMTEARPDASGIQSDHEFTVTIPPEYYFRPVNVGFGSSSRSECRVFGIEEGSAIILGNTFMDGLYVYHDLVALTLGIAVADNCENNAVSLKVISEPRERKQSWCECLSSSQRRDASTRIVGYYPGSQKCFFWMWWMYVIIGCGVVVVLLAVASVWICLSRRRAKSLVTTTTAGNSPYFKAGSPMPLLSRDSQNAAPVPRPPSGRRYSDASEVYIAGAGSSPGDPVVAPAAHVAEPVHLIAIPNTDTLPVTSTEVTF